MYNTTLTKTKISSGENQGQVEFKTYGIVWDDNQYLSKSKIAEQPVMNDYNTHIAS